MAINFPASLDDLTPITDGTVASPVEWNDLQDAIEALETKVGIDDSAVATSHDCLVSRKLAARQDEDGDSDSYFDIADRYRINCAGVNFFCINTSYVHFYKHIVPMDANVWDWGASSHKWNDMRLNGTLYLDGGVIGTSDHEINHLKSNLDYISLGLQSGHDSMRFRHSRLYIRGTIIGWDYDLYNVHNGGACAETHFNNGATYFRVGNSELGHDCDVVFACKLSYGDGAVDFFSFVGEADGNDLWIYPYDPNGGSTSLTELKYYFIGRTDRYCYVDIWYGSWDS